ncbi:ABC transporter ATP-binding protein [Paratractidigestivibacter sp.]|uniref:ABC transporter ATP-binding protein n=1 Tax=Paratractidigestivibacter sp. TaxID=2847316 RepID=UPI002ABE5D9E|nr:ATP-binding cassette domain-containing protein [Paratractidigestivibacter sp.]
MTTQAAPNSVIRAQGLTKTYGKFNAVDGLSMDVREGDIYGFVGRNGAGKSTTMRMICGLIVPTAGELDVLGQDPSVGGGRTAVGAIIEAPGLLDKSSAMDNLMYKAIALGVPKARAHCQELLQIVGLQDTGSKQSCNFSLGMRQRLGIALAMVGNPRILLLDEPFNGLDPGATREMRETLQKINREREMTIIVSSHVLDQLNRFATRFGVINAGRMVAEFESEKMAELAAGAIRVRCKDMPAAGLALRQALPGVDVTLSDDGVYQVPSTKATVEQVSDALFAAHQQVLELHKTERDVEDFFLELMDESGASVPAAQ